MAACSIGPVILPGDETLSLMVEAFSLQVALHFMLNQLRVYLGLSIAPMSLSGKVAVNPFGISLALAGSANHGNGGLTGRNDW